MNVELLIAAITAIAGISSIYIGVFNTLKLKRATSIKSDNTEILKHLAQLKIEIRTDLKNVKDHLEKSDNPDPDLIKARDKITQQLDKIAQLERALLVTREDIDSVIKEIKKQSLSAKFFKEKGSSTKNFLVYIVPGVVALAVTGVYLYLIAMNQNNPDYIAPGQLTNTMTVLLGYLFGAGAGASASAPPG